MPYFLAIGHSEAKPLIMKMGHVSLDDGNSLGLIVNSFENVAELKKEFKRFLQIIKEKKNAS